MSGSTLLRTPDDLTAGYGRGVEASLAKASKAMRVLRGDYTQDLSIQPKRWAAAVDVGPVAAARVTDGSRPIRS